jgi:hypothetical protein
MNKDDGTEVDTNSTSFHEFGAVPFVLIREIRVS